MSSKQTIFYYSNFCPHSQRVLQFMVRANLTTEAAFICIDKRGNDPNTNQMYIIMENGDRVLMPPNIHSVPALLMMSANYKVIYGDEIIRHYEPNIVNDKIRGRWEYRWRQHTMVGNQSRHLHQKKATTRLKMETIR